VNIFYLDKEVVPCAQMHLDKHCVKMILEYAQLLSTAHRVLDGMEMVRISPATGRKQKVWVLPDARDEVIYTVTHIQHPSAVWVRESKQHYQWLFKLFVALMEEYTHRYGRVHATNRLKDFLKKTPKNIKNTPFVEPPPTMPEEYKVVGDTVASYQNYYNGAKRKIFAWKNRAVPDFIIEV